MKFVSLPLRPIFPVMDAQSVRQLPEGPDWQYEPKWDGFRCLAFRDHDEIVLQAKSGKSLDRFFPDIVALLKSLPVLYFILDSELVIPVAGELSFEALQMRLHPAASRVRMLAAAHPATLIVFDLLVDADGRDVTRTPLKERRRLLERFHVRFARGRERFFLSPATTDRQEAMEWFRRSGSALDGIVAKRLDFNYRSGDRTGMVKYKNIRSADCVVGGFRYMAEQKLVGSLLLGLYGEDGLLHHVGYTSSIKDSERKDLTQRLKGLKGPPGFTGRSPGGPSRWAPQHSGDWEPLKPALVVEVEYDHFTGGRFRHGTRLMRFRPDKSPIQCRFDQLDQKSLKSLWKDF